MNLLKIINIGWWVSVSENKSTSDGDEAAFRYEFTVDIGAWILLSIKGADTPKIIPLPSRAVGHQN